MSVLPAKCSDKATSKQIKRETLEPNIIIPMLCSDDETPPPLTDNGLDAGPLTTVKCEVVAVCGKEPKIEVSIADVKPPNTPILAEPVSSVPPPVFKYGCPTCPKEFDDKIERMLHKQIHSFEEIPRISDISGFRVIDLDAAERRTICGQGDETHQTDVEESNTAEEVGSEIENGSFNMHDANVDSIEDGGPTLDEYSKYKCSYCERMCRDNHDLHKHLMIHTGEKPHKCDVCGKGFIIKAACLAHKMTHTGNRPHKCTDCGNTFALKRSYLQHCKIHSGEKPHCCQFCGKRFSRAEGFKYHVSLHKGPKPYRCLMCKKNMTSVDKWKRHVEKKHKEEYEDVASGRKEKKKTSQEKPRKKSHECGTCKNCFRDPRKLEVHQRIHTGEQPYCCEFCDRRFTVKTNLNKHLLTHSGTKPYLCIICKIPFSTKDEMVSHRQMTHEKEQ